MRPAFNPQMALGKVRADDYKKARKRILGKRGIVRSGIDPEDLGALQSNNTNTLAERFNRTIQEHFVDYHEYLLFSNFAQFNHKMADWPISYNTIVPHHSQHSNHRHNP